MCLSAHKKGIAVGNKPHPATKVGEFNLQSQKVSDLPESRLVDLLPEIEEKKNIRYIKIKLRTTFKERAYCWLL